MRRRAPRTSLVAPVGRVGGCDPPADQGRRIGHADAGLRRRRRLADQVEREPRHEAEHDQRGDQRPDHPTLAHGQVTLVGETVAHRSGEDPLVGEQHVQGRQHHAKRCDDGDRLVRGERPDEDQQLADERRKTGQRQRRKARDQERPGQHRYRLLQTTEVPDPGGAPAAHQEPGDQEQRTGREPVGEHVQRGALDADRGERKDPQHDEAEVAHRGVGDQPHQVLLADRQEDLMRLIAYTSVSHFGFIVLGIFAFTSVSIQGSSLYMLTHGLSTGALFLVAGFLVRRWGTARVGDLGGLQKVVPVLAGTFLVAGLSALSLPGLAPFVSELLVFVGTFAAHKAVAVVATLGVVLAALYVLLAYQRIFTGPVRGSLSTQRDLSVRERWVIGPLVAALIVLGFVPGLALDLVREPATATQSSVGVTDPAPLVSWGIAATDTTDGSDK